MVEVRIVVTGAGVGGLTAALLLARDGHDVVILERDSHPSPRARTRPSRGTAAALRRCGIRTPSSAASATSSAMTCPTSSPISSRRAPPRSAGRTSRRKRWMTARPSPATRTWPSSPAAARRSSGCSAVGARTKRVELRDGVRVTGLRTAAGSSPPRVTGVETESGPVEADLVVDAGGRHSALVRLLEGVGVTLTEEKHDAGMVYLSRFYRLREGADRAGCQRIQRRHARLSRLRRLPWRQPHVLGHARHRHRGQGAARVDRRRGLRCRRGDASGCNRLGR